MKALHGGRTKDFQLQYHLGRNDTPNFEQGQPGRIDLARMFIEKMLLKDLPQRPLKIIELGCGSGDVSGPYAGPPLDVPDFDYFSVPGNVYSTPRGMIDTKGIDVIGIDVVPQAISAQRRFPNMTVLISPVEELEPISCDLLVMTEFLEHLANPMAVVDAWMPHARMALIGHPIDEPDPPYEHGHSWSYNLDDWHNWFNRHNFHIWERVLFPMGHYENMVLGHGSRR